MSSDADAAAAIVALFNSIYAGNYCAIAASALFFYDAFVVTVDREVACFWTATRTGGSILFFANKWVSMLLYTMGLVVFASFPSDESCSLFVRAGAAVKALQLVPGAVFSALRAFVLSRSKLLGMLVLALSLAPVGANMAQYAYPLAGEDFAPFGCVQTGDIAPGTTTKFAYVNQHNICYYASADAGDRTVILISRIPLIVADVLLIYITWTKLSSRDNTRGLQQSKRLSLSQILLRDGIIYFVVLFILNVLHLVLSVTAVAGDLEGSYVTEFTAPLTAILISRFLLELQEANQMVVQLDRSDSSGDPYHTQSSISSLGAFINPELSASYSDVAFESYMGSFPGAGKEDGDANQGALLSSA